MNKMQKSLLVASLIASMGLSSAYAATNDGDTNSHKMRDLVASYETKNETENNAGMAWREKGPNGRQAKHARHGNKQGYGVAFNELAALTGKDAKTIAEECRKDKITPAAYAKKAGVLDQYKAKRKAALEERLNKAVIDGKITRDKADKAMNTFDQRFQDEVDGKRPAAMHLNRRSPMGMGKMPYDTLAALTHKDIHTLMDDARNNKKTCYDLAKDAGVLKEYKAERIAINKEILTQLVKDGKMEQKRADEILKDVTNRIENGKQEHHPRVNPMHPGPVRMPQK